MVNQCFDRIVELANRPQSIDSCSPLLSLLLDAACQVDCIERKENPNKRWNGRVERDLRKKVGDRCLLFAIVLSIIYVLTVLVYIVVHQ